MFIAKVVALVLSGTAAFGAAISGGGFEDVSALPGLGWDIVNNSSPEGSTSWFQGNAAAFPAQAGAPDSYAAANFNAAGFGGDISLWLLTPVLTFTPGGSISFFTRTEAGSPAPDGLEIRLSTNGGSANVGASAASTGDFTALLGSINPTLGVGNYPELWTEYTFAIPVLSATSGRVGFRYLVSDTSANGDYIGIDSVSAEGVVPEPGTLTCVPLAGTALFCAAWLRRRAANRNNKTTRKSNKEQRQ